MPRAVTGTTCIVPCFSVVPIVIGYFNSLIIGRSVVVSALASINIANRHWARLVLGWVTACGLVNYLGM